MGQSPEAPSLVAEELKRAWRELRGSDASPARVAIAVALGLFVGSIPIYGCHTPIVLTLCLLLQLDGLSAWLAANISNPFFSPALLTAEVQVGAYLHTGGLLPLHDLELARETGFSGVMLYLFTGAPVLAAGLALVGGLLVYLLLALKRRYRPAAARQPYRLADDAPPWWRATERVASRYAPSHDASTPAQRSRFHYVRIKLLSDPVAKMVTDLGGDLGHVLDVGTGRGQLPIALLELGVCRSAHGIDWDETKIDSARAAAAEAPALEATFELADVREAELPEADTVLLMDVVHYLSVDEQNDLLDRAAAAVRSGGTLVVREADTEQGWRSWITLAEEKLFTLLRFNVGARVRFRAASEIVARLTECGLKVEVLPAWGRMPLSNVLIVATR